MDEQNQNIENEQEEAAYAEEAGTPELGPDQVKRRSIRAGTITGVVLAAIAAVLIILLLDPFNLHLIDRLTGRYDAAMASMPIETKLYFGVDLRNATPEKIDRLIKPFADAAEDPEITDFESIIQQIDDSLEQDLGITFSEDIQPWLGQYIGVGLLDFDMSGFNPLGYMTTYPPEVRIILAIETRDREKADAFLTKLGESLTEGSDLQEQTTEYRGVSITYWESDDPGGSLAFGRNKGVVLVGSFVDDVKQSIDAAAGESLADHPDFLALRGNLSRDRFLTIFTNGQAFSELYKDFPGFEFAAVQFEILTGYAITFSIVDAGFEMDALVSIDREAYLEEYGEEYPSLDLDPLSASLIPENSVLYLGGVPMENFSEGYQTSLDQMEGGEDIAEAIELLSDEIGLDLIEFFGALDGEFAISVLPKDLDPETNPFGAIFPVDLMIMIGTTQQEKMLTMLDPLAAYLEREAGIAMEPVSRGEFTLYDMVDPYYETPIFIFGVGKDHLVLTTSNEVLEASFGGGPSLAADEGFLEAAAALPRDMTPLMYLDVQGLVVMISSFDMMVSQAGEAGQQPNPLQPLRSVSMGVANIDDSTIQVTVLAIIDAPLTE